MKVYPAQIAPVFHNGAFSFNGYRNGRRKSYLMVCCLSICFFFTGIMTIHAQQVFTTSQLLNNSEKVNGDSTLQGSLQFLNNTEQGMPFVDEMQIRTETDELDFNRQEYLFRIRFNSKKARLTQDALTQNNIRLYELRSELLRESALVDRYELIVKWYYTELELAYYQEKNILLEDKKTVYQKMLANAIVPDIENLLKVDEDLEEQRREVLQLELERKYIIQQLFPWQNDLDAVKLDSKTWISMEVMESVLNEIKDLPASNLEQALQEIKINYEKLEYDMEKAESRKILDFAQIKYAGRDKLEVQKELSVGLGINIPTKSRARVKLNEATLDIFDEKYKQELLEADIEEETFELFTDFNAFKSEHELIQEQMSDNQFDKLIEKYSNSGAIHPITLLRLKERLLKNQKSLRAIEKDACLAFLEILRYKGLLSQTPATNYLSNKLEPF